MVTRLLEILELRRGRQLAVEQQVADLEKMRLLGELLDRVAAVQELALVAVDVGDRALAGAGRGEARVEGEDAAFGVEPADIDDVGPDRALVDRQVERLCPRSSAWRISGPGRSCVVPLCRARAAARRVPRARHRVTPAIRSCRRSRTGTSPRRSTVVAQSASRASAFLAPEDLHHVEHAGRNAAPGQRGADRLGDLAEPQIPSSAAKSRTHASRSLALQLACCMREVKFRQHDACRRIEQLRRRRVGPDRPRSSRTKRPISRSSGIVFARSFMPGIARAASPAAPVRSGGRCCDARKSSIAASRAASSAARMC